MSIGASSKRPGGTAMEANPPGNMSLFLGNTLAATFLHSAVNLINLAKCIRSGKAESMFVASLAECIAQII